MHLTLSPVRGLPGQPQTTLHVEGDVITVDGISYDLGAVPVGGEATPEGEFQPFIGRILRPEASIHCTVRVILGDDATPQQPDSPWVIADAEGPVFIPARRIATALESDPETLA